MSDLTFFIDRDLGSHVVAKALRAEGVSVVTHKELFAPDTPDQDWLTLAGERKYIVLTKDRKIRRRPLEVLAIQFAAVRAVILTVEGAKGQEIAEIILKALPKIRRDVAVREGPCIFTLTKAGVLKEVGTKRTKAPQGS